MGLTVECCVWPVAQFCKMKNTQDKQAERETNRETPNETKTWDVYFVFSGYANLGQNHAWVFPRVKQSDVPTMLTKTISEGRRKIQNKLLLYTEGWESLFSHLSCKWK